MSALASRVTGREPDVTPEGVAIVCDETTCDSAMAQRELGYRPATLREMVEDCYAWMKTEGLVA